MSSGFVYNKVLKYKVQAELTAPLHVGSTGGDPEEILVHPVDGRPFIQASGIAGAFREAYTDLYGNPADSLFGSQDAESSSRIVFSDGILREPERQEAESAPGVKSTSRAESRFRRKSGFEAESAPRAASTELRPRVRIDPVTGSVGTAKIKGTRNASGTKFNMQYVGAGTELEFTAYIFTGTDEEKDDKRFRSLLEILQGNGIQFGGQKSNGCGYVQLTEVLFKEFDLREENGRRDWIREDQLKKDQYQRITNEITKASINRFAYVVTIEGQTEGNLLVKALSVPEVGENAPDAQNIQNAKGDYIIPGSSLKGAIRARMTMIARYLEENHSGIHSEELIGNAFGTIRSGRQSGSTGATGNLRFRDTVVGNKEQNDLAALHHRIHIDKFTAGVINGGLFSTKDVSGAISITIGIEDRNRPEQTLGLLVLALRDLAAGCFNLGSGYNVGKGFLNVTTIQVTGKAGEQQKATMKVREGEIDDDAGMLRQAIASLRGAAG